MTQATAIGLNVQERDVVDTPLVGAPPIGQVGAVFESPRGPLNVAVRATSLGRCRQVWGGLSKKYKAGYCMRGLFKNAGQYGAVLYGTRITTSAMNAAIAATILGSVVEPFALAPNDDIVIDTDNGGDETATFLATKASVVGNGGTFPTSFAGGETLSFRVEGKQIDVIFTAAAQAINDVLVEINAAGEGFSAKASGGEVQILSDVFGTSSSIEILAGGTALAGLGLTAGTSLGTGNVTNIKKVTVAEVKAIVEAATTALNVLSDGGKVRFTGTQTGVSGEVDIKSGAAVSKLGHVVGTTNGTNTGSAAPTPAFVTLQRSSTDVWTFTAGFLGRQDPGAWANGSVYLFLSANLTDSNKRDLSVRYKEPGSTTAVEVERWTGLDASNVVSVLNNPTQGSEYVVVNIEGGDSGMPDVSSNETALSSGTVGKDAVASPTNSDYEGGLASFNGLDTQVITNFDLDDAMWAGSLESYCAGRADVLGVFQTPQGASIAAIKADFASLRKGKSFIAGYRSYCEVNDGFGGAIKVPVIGHVIGAAYIRKPRSRGDIVHTAPAGKSTFLLDVLSVDDAIYSQPQLKELANDTHINSIVFESKSGFYVKTSRTMSTENKWLSIHVRLLTNHIKVSFQESLGDLEQEGNNPDTRRRLRDSVIDFMEQLDNQNAFEKSGGFGNNVAVVCDESNNPQRTVQQRRMVCDVAYRPAEIAEEVAVNLIQTRDGIQVVDA